MIYKVAGLTFLVGASTTEGALFRKHTASALGSGTRRGIDVGKVRGSTDVATVSDANLGFVTHTSSLMSVEGYQAEFATLSAVRGGSVYGQDVALGGDYVTGNIMFTNEMGTINSGSVVYHRGMFNSWSVQQILTPPAEFAEQNFFGKVFDLDRNSQRQLAVGCSGCNSSFSQSGSLFVYEPTSPDAKKWAQTAMVSFNQGQGLWGMGNYQVSIHKDVLTVDGRTLEDGTTFANFNVHSAIFQKDAHGHWDQKQALSLGPIAVSDKATRSEVFDETIVVSGASRTPMKGAAGYGTGAVHIFYPNTKRFDPKAKPAPIQWSVQQILVSPLAVGTVASPTALGFGQSLSVEGNRMYIGESSSATGWVYERQSLSGMWSVQQRLAPSAATVEAVVTGASIFTVAAGGVDRFDETGKWDCLLVSLEDHFNDGWGTAELVVDVPGGEKDSFATRCDTSNPFQFRYCPAAQEDGGLYKFAIPGGNKAKFHWEMIWRVYEESTGNWYTGNWDTKMDFEWNSDKKQFTHKKIEHELPNNITCKACKQKPTAKPSSRLRQLKDSTVHPTISPAPTIATTLIGGSEWQSLFMNSAGLGIDWFDSQHKGTSYYISTKDGKRLLSTGTMCPWQALDAGHSCWEDYPDGEYILRVGGALDRVTDHTFKFCNMANEQPHQTQVVFRVQNGECSIVSNVNSVNLCSRGGLTQVSNVEISILGVSTVTSADYSEIKSAIASALPGVSASGVTILSVVAAGSGVTVSAEIAADASVNGIDYTDADSLDAYEARTIATLSTGSVFNALISGEHASNVHSASGVQLISFKLSGNGEVTNHAGPDMITDFVDSLSEDASTDAGRDSSASSIISAVSIAGYVLAAMGVMMVGFFVATRTPAQQPVATSDVEVVAVEAAIAAEAGASPKKKVSVKGADLTLANLTELVKNEEIALEAMLKNAPQL